MLKIVSDLQVAGIDGSRLNTALDGTMKVNESNEKMRADLEALAIELKDQVDSIKTSSSTQIEGVRDEASKWAETFKSNLYAIMGAGNLDIPEARAAEVKIKTRRALPLTGRRLQLGSCQWECRSSSFGIGSI